MAIHHDEATVAPIVFDWKPDRHGLSESARFVRGDRTFHATRTAFPLGGYLYDLLVGDRCVYSGNQLDELRARIEAESTKPKTAPEPLGALDHETGRYHPTAPRSADPLPAEPAPNLLTALKDVVSSGAESHRTGERYSDVVIAGSAYEQAVVAIANAPPLGDFHRHERNVKAALYQRALWLMCQSPSHSDRTAAEMSARTRLVSTLFEIDAKQVGADLAKMRSETPRFATAELDSADSVEGR